MSREACERFWKIEFFSDVPDLGVESFTAFLTYSTAKEQYEMWIFSSSSEQPLHMTGDFDGRSLVLVSDPWPTNWGLQRLRSTLTPRSDGSYELTTDLWEPDGYARYRHTVFHRVPVTV